MLTSHRSKADQDRAEDVYLELEARAARGEVVSLTDLCGGVPELVEAVRAIEAKCARFDAVAGAPPPAGPSAAAVLAEVAGGDLTEIGRGASSIVYKGFDEDFGTTVAYKVLDPDDAGLSAEARGRLMRRFEGEIHILARLKHDAIVRIYKTLRHRDRVILVMEYLAGGSLEARKAEYRGRPGEVARLVGRVADAIGHAHAARVVHRDLKPGNILLDEKGDPCVSDFGVAKLLRPEDPAPPVPGAETVSAVATVEDGPDPGITRAGRQPGTWAYMAPEQFDPALGSVSPATDVWALGVVLYELLTGSRPFAAETREEWRAVVCYGQLPPRPRGLGFGGRRLWSVVRRCLEKEPGKRYRTATELAAALRVQPARWWQWPVVATAAGCVFVGGALIPRPKPPGEVPEPAAVAPTWPDLPEVNALLQTLERDGRVQLVGEDRPPVAFDHVMGPQSAKVLKTPSTFTVCSAGAVGCFVELLPRLPAGRYEIEAVLQHVDANGMSWVGLFAAGDRHVLPRGTQYYCAMIRFADLGVCAAEVPDPKATLSRRTHLSLVYVGESDTTPLVGCDLPSPHPGGVPVVPPPRGPRRVVLRIDAQQAAAFQGSPPAQQPVLVGECNTATAVGFRDLLRANFADLRDLNWPRPNRMAGAVGFYVHQGTVSVSAFTVKRIEPGG